MASKRYRVKLGDTKHRLPKALFLLYLQERFIERSQKDARLAHVNPRFIARVDAKTGFLLFEAADKSVDPHAVDSQFRRILQLLKYQPPYDEWAIEQQKQLDTATSWINQRAA